jgi:hypothetical protein
MVRWGVLLCAIVGCSDRAKDCRTLLINESLYRRWLLQHEQIIRDVASADHCLIEMGLSATNGKAEGKRVPCFTITVRLDASRVLYGDLILSVDENSMPTRVQYGMCCIVHALRPDIGRAARGGTRGYPARRLNHEDYAAVVRALVRGDRAVVDRYASLPTDDTLYFPDLYDPIRRVLATGVLDQRDMTAKEVDKRTPQNEGKSPSNRTGSPSPSVSPSK